MTDAIDIHAEDLYSISKDALKKGLSIRLRAWGQSMSKTIRNGECIEIKPISPQELNKGDIIFFFSNNRPYVHRLIKKISKDNITVFRTKGDQVFCLDAPINPDEILGKVVAVRKKNQWLDLNKNTTVLERFLNVSLSILRPYFLSMLERFKQLGGYIFKALLGKRYFRRLFCYIFPLKNISVAIASEEDLDTLYIDFGIQDSPKKEDFWFVAKVSQKLIAAVSMSMYDKENLSNEDVWFLSSLRSKPLYRGRGAAERLCIEAMQEVKKRGGCYIRLRVPKENKAAINLYEKLGFERDSMELVNGIYEIEMVKKI